MTVNLGTTLTEERHRNSLANNKGYCRQVTTADLTAEITALM